MTGTGRGWDLMRSRRGFIGLGVGALAARCLPLMAEKDRQIWYASEPKGEALLDMPIMKAFKPTMLEIKVGAKAPFEILHFSDSHLAWMNSRDLMKADEVELKWYEGRRRHFAGNATGLAAALAYAKAKKLRLVHTGDLLDYLSDANLRIGKHDLEGFDCLYAIGNHEYAGTPRPTPKTEWLKAAREKLEPFFPNGFACASRVINGVNFVAVDNVGMCRDIFEPQFAAIKAEFAKGLPTVLAYHIPFFSPELAKMEMSRHPDRLKTVGDITCDWLAAPPGKGDIPLNKALVKWLPEQKNLKALLCGHLHYEAQVPFSETVTQYVAGATYKGNAYHIRFV